MSGYDGNAPTATEPCEPRIVQLVSDSRGLLALDDTGRVWEHVPSQREWREVKAKFVRGKKS